MSSVNVRLPRLLWLLMGALVPLLFLLDWAVGTSGRRTYAMQAELAVRLDGADPLTLAVPLEPVHGPEGLELTGTARLQEFHYPWKATPLAATFWLRLDRELIENHVDGGRHDGFVASLTVTDESRSDGLSTPPFPCEGDLVVERMHGTPNQLDEANIRVDLLCTSSGPDLKWNSGDERVWALTGPIGLVTDGASATTERR